MKISYNKSSSNPSYLQSPRAYHCGGFSDIEEYFNNLDYLQSDFHDFACHKA